MASASRCLVDAAVLIESVRCGRLGEMCRAHRIGAGELTVALATRQRSGLPPSWPVELAGFVADGRIEVLSASAIELAEVVRWVGSWSMCGAELELLALGLAGKSRVCTEDAVVQGAMRELGIEAQQVALSELFAATGG